MTTAAVTKSSTSTIATVTTQNLRDEQRHVARVEQATLTGPRELRHTEQAREHAAQDAADAVATERVERIVVAKLGLKMADGQVADRRDDQAHDQRRPRLDKARTRRDHHKAPRRRP